MDYAVTQCTSHNVPSGRHLGSIEAILLPTAPRTLDRAFRAVHQINEWRFSPAATSLAPDIVVVAVAHFSAGTAADFRGQCCRIVQDIPAAIYDEFSILRIERERLKQKGVALLWANAAGPLPSVFLAGLSGRHAEMDLNSRETRLLRKLASERRVFDQAELASAAACRRDQIKVYVERLRTEYDRLRREVGVLMDKNDFIKNPGHGLGYRLHARLRTV